jgi:hypothetical protein
MKKNIYFICTFALLVFILSSCSKRETLIKRHYTKGYYHHRLDAKPDVAIKKNSPARSLAIKKEDAYLKPVEKTKAIEPVDLVAENTVKKERTAETNKVAINKKYNASKPISFADPKKQMDLLSDAIKIGTAQDVARDALSLLWILILALLIVYIVGLLLDSFGLGWAFHILGVIILVLLILWLLRII